MCKRLCSLISNCSGCSVPVVQFGGLGLSQLHLTDPFLEPVVGVWQALEIISSVHIIALCLEDQVLST